jgi:hypothetical protein
MIRGGLDRSNEDVDVAEEQHELLVHWSQLDMDTTFYLSNNEVELHLMEEKRVA